MTSIFLYKRVTLPLLGVQFQFLIAGERDAKCSQRDGIGCVLVTANSLASQPASQTMKANLPFAKQPHLDWLNLDIRASELLLVVGNS